MIVPLTNACSKVASDNLCALSHTPPPQVEVHNAARLLHHLGDDRSLAVPRVFIELSTSKLLTMEWVEGAKVTDVAALKQMGISPRQVGVWACVEGGHLELWSGRTCQLWPCGVCCTSCTPACWCGLTTYACVLVWPDYIRLRAGVA
jgi:hypothetical protein